MPGAESDFPSRKQRKAAGKGNVRGRVAGDLPIYDLSNSLEAENAVERDSGRAKGEGTVSYGFVA